MMMKTIGIRETCWTNPSLRCSDAGLSDAGADDDGQKGQELGGCRQGCMRCATLNGLLIDLHVSRGCRHGSCVCL